MEILEKYKDERFLFSLIQGGLESAFRADRSLEEKRE